MECMLAAGRRMRFPLELLRFRAAAFPHVTCAFRTTKAAACANDSPCGHGNTQPIPSAPHLDVLAARGRKAVDGGLERGQRR